MPDIVSGKIWVDGEKGVTATKMNSEFTGAVIQPSFVGNKPLTSSIAAADQLLVLQSGGAYARAPFSIVTSSVANQLTPAGVNQAGVVNPLSGVSTDYIGGDNQCHPLPVSSFVPTGGVLDFAGSAAPTGFLLCDGSAVSRTTYATLFGVIGSTWGAGDGSTTFNLPDLRSRVAVGAGQGTSLTNRVLAAKGGEETHQLVASEMPIHNHSATDGGHTHVINQTGVAVSAGGTNIFWGGAGSASSTAVGYASISVGNAGGNGAHNTMPPFAVMNKIIKT